MTTTPQQQPSIIEQMCRSSVLLREPTLQLFYCGKKRGQGGGTIPRIILADSLYFIDASFNTGFHSDDIVKATVLPTAYICLTDYTLERSSKGTNKTYYYLKVKHYKVKHEPIRNQKGKTEKLDESGSFAHMQDIN